MRVRSVLALLVGAERALVANIRGGRAELAVGTDSKDDDVAGGVVCHQEVFACFVERDVAGIFAERR